MGYAPGDQSWQDGYEFASSGMWCTKCWAAVKKSPSAADAHREWHEKLEQLGG